MNVPSIPAALTRSARLRAARAALLLMAVCVAPPVASAQSASSGSSAGPPAGLQALAWLAGDWQSVMPNGALNETSFMRPRAGVMTGVMRLSKDGALLVQELLAIVEKDGTIEMRLRHFGRDLAAQEAAPIVLTLTKLTADRAEFEGTYNSAPMRTIVQKSGVHGWTGESIFQGRDGKPTTIANAFTRRRASDAPADGASEPPPHVTDTSYDAPNGMRVLRQSITVPATLEQVWHAFTTPEGLRMWAVPFAEVDFRLGGIWESSYRLDARPGDPANIKNRFLAYQPLRMIAIQAVQAPPGFPHPELLPNLWTVIELEPLGDRQVRLTSSGIGYRDTPEYRQLYTFFEKGNAWTLRQLHRRFTEGPVDWTTAEPAKK